MKSASQSTTATIVSVKCLSKVHIYIHKSHISDFPEDWLVAWTFAQVFLLLLSVCVCTTMLCAQVIKVWSDTSLDSACPKLYKAHDSWWIPLQDFLKPPNKSNAHSIIITFNSTTDGSMTSSFYGVWCCCCAAAFFQLFYLYMQWAMALALNQAILLINLWPSNEIQSIVK